MRAFSCFPQQSAYYNNRFSAETYQHAAVLSPDALAIDPDSGTGGFFITIIRKPIAEVNIFIHNCMPSVSKSQIESLPFAGIGSLKGTGSESSQP